MCESELRRNRPEGFIHNLQHTVDIVGRIDSIAPGASSELSLDLDRGSYVLICNIVAGDKSHYISGMYNLFTVSSNAPAPASQEATE